MLYGGEDLETVSVQAIIKTKFSTDFVFKDMKELKQLLQPVSIRAVQSQVPPVEFSPEHNPVNSALYIEGLKCHLYWSHADGIYLMCKRIIMLEGCVNWYMIFGDVTTWHISGLCSRGKRLLVCVLVCSKHFLASAWTLISGLGSHRSRL